MLINILTRTSGRPRAFKKCYKSIVSQTYNNFRHIVSYDDPKDVSYLRKYPIDTLRVETMIISEEEKKSSDKEFKPYNLYCNDLLNEVKEGWIMFLDDDDMLNSKHSLHKVVDMINLHDEDTLIIWQTQYPNGSLLPPEKVFAEKRILLRQIDTACFIFHSKHKNASEWDSWWAADFRFVDKLAEVIPKQKWVKEIITKKNTLGGNGKRRDLPRKKNFIFRIICKLKKIYDS